MDRENIEKIRNSIKTVNPLYEFVRVLGHGSIGSVYECSNDTGTHIAVKMMEITPMIDSEVFDAIIHTALATRSLAEHTNVAKVISVGKTDDFYYICMEMISGGTLEETVSDKSIPLKKKLQIAKKIADILTVIHAKGIVHQDLKPSNILMDSGGNPYLTDFYLFSSHGKQGSFSMPHGTPYYMSPEQTSGRMVTLLTDIYSFGVLFYELLTGEMPYDSAPQNIRDMVTVVNEGKIIKPSRKNPKIDSKLQAVIMKLLEGDPGKRYQNMGEVADDIQACIDKKPISIPYNNSFISMFLQMFR